LGSSIPPDLAALLNSLASSDPTQLQQLLQQTSISQQSQQNSFDSLAHSSSFPQHSSVDSFHHQTRALNDFSITSNSIPLNISAPTFQPKSFEQSMGKQNQQSFSGNEGIQGQTQAHEQFSSASGLGSSFLQSQTNAFNSLSAQSLPSAQSHIQNASPSQPSSAPSASSLGLHFSSTSQLRRSAPSFTPRFS
jgi:hypothetical protein